LGKLFERLWPFRQELDHDPRDMRVILDPIDYVVFHGLTTRRRVDRITFIEVKAGASRPPPCQNSIRDAVVEKRVDFKLCQIDG
jgi:predicted Holliday junction resolvase-like endonuclease